MHHWTSHRGPGRRGRPNSQTGTNSDTGSIHFVQFPATLVQLAEAPPSFLPFCERPSSCHTCRIPMVPILQIHTHIPPVQIAYLHIQKYRTQDHGAGGRPIGSLTTIHTNIPAITITILDMELWNVIRLLYVYACISLSGYMTKLLVMHLEQVMSL